MLASLVSFVWFAVTLVVSFRFVDDSVFSCTLAMNFHYLQYILDFVMNLFQFNFTNSGVEIVVKHFNILCFHFAKYQPTSNPV